MAEKKRGLGRGLSALLGDFPARNENEEKENNEKAVVPTDENKGTKSLTPSLTQSEALPQTPQQPVARPVARPPAQARPVQSAQPPTDKTNKYVMLSLDQLMPSATQPRKNFPEAQLNELAQSLKEKGVLQPLLVRPTGADSTGETRGAPYEIIAGERRWRAAQRAQLHEIPVIIHNLDDSDSLEAGIVENIQRADLNPIEEAQAYRRLMTEFNYTQDMLAKKLGKSRPYIANSLRLNNVTEKIRQSLIEGQLTAGHARALLAYPRNDKEGYKEGDKEIDKIAAQIIADGLSVRQTEKLVTQLARKDSQSKSPAQPKQKDANIRALENAVAERLGLQVDIRHKDKSGGEMRIYYKTVEQIENVMRRLMRD
ncbi:MAG: ParB/RepB/Spo0J family partition protein [Alphaproteobacteria bacterium]|nr:ParB/RepB/Spo0J family partition protein [Alphaproteobacteria bacterium]